MSHSHPFRASIVVFLGVLALARGDAPPATTDLLARKDLSAWEFVGPPATAVGAVCAYQADGSLAVVGKPVGFLATKATHENFRLHAEWRWTDQPGNGGVLVHIASGPKDRQWPMSFQIQTKHKSVGDLLPMAGATFAEPLTSAAGAAVPLRAHAAADSEKPAGEWNACDIVCRGDTIEVSINGVAQNRVTGCAPRAGRIGFQLEGTPFELRNVRLEPLPGK